MCVCVFSETLSHTPGPALVPAAHTGCYHTAGRHEEDDLRAKVPQTENRGTINHPHKFIIHFVTSSRRWFVAKKNNFL